MKKISTLFVLAALSFGANAQPYTTNQFQYDSLLNVSYGTAIDYVGNSQNLLMDIYKPIGDNNCLRPVMVLVHGGSWIGGSKEDQYMVLMARELAKKGWVVASINYRLGTHKAANYNMYAFCNASISAPCAYICDSSEIYRANFRGMQDAKGAIRFMKDRFELDSTDVNNVYIAGESAGGFVAFAAAFTDQASEKSADCFAIANAPNPSANLAPYGCIPSNNSLSRPDLGSIDGTLNVGTHDASVKGIGSFYGGVLDLQMLQQTGPSPDVYMFHQGSDVIVNYGYGPLLGRLSWECYDQINLCQHYYFYPSAYGSLGLTQYFQGLGSSAPTYISEIIENYDYLNNCDDNGHSIDNWVMRLQSMINLFAAKIDLSGNDPATNCLTIGTNELQNATISIFPNPAKDQLTIQRSGNSGKLPYTITDVFGKTIASGELSGDATKVDVSNFSKGIYFVHVQGRLIKWVKE